MCPNKSSHALPANFSNPSNAKPSRVSVSALISRKLVQLENVSYYCHVVLAYLASSCKCRRARQALSRQLLTSLSDTPGSAFAPRDTMLRCPPRVTYVTTFSKHHILNLYLAAYIFETILSRAFYSVEGINNCSLLSA